MADFTLCPAQGCLLALNCKRYTGAPSDNQLYYSDAPYRVVNGKTECDMFWGETSESIINQLNEIMNGNERTDKGNSEEFEQGRIG